jgi:hypothetical protein
MSTSPASVQDLLFQAVVDNAPERIHAAIQAGADVKATQVMGVLGETTPLESALAHGNVQALRVLHEAGAPWSDRTEFLVRQGPMVYQLIPLVQARDDAAFEQGCARLREIGAYVREHQPQLAPAMDEFLIDIANLKAPLPTPAPAPRRGLLRGWRR